MANSLVRVVLFAIGTLLLLGCLFDIYRAYTASKGLLTTGILVAKTAEVPAKAAIRIYKFQLAFRTPQHKPVLASLEVTSDKYASLNPRDSVQLRYAAHNPANVILAAGGWFPWRLLGIAPLGVVLLITASNLGTQRPA